MHSGRIAAGNSRPPFAPPSGSVRLRFCYIQPGFKGPNRDLRRIKVRSVASLRLRGSGLYAR